MNEKFPWRLRFFEHGSHLKYDEGASQKWPAPSDVADSRLVSRSSQAESRYAQKEANESRLHVTGTRLD